MSIVGSVGDKRRKSRNILLLAFIILVVLWIFKLSHPRFSLFQAYSNVSSSSTPVEYVKDHGIDSNARWKTRIGNPEALSTDIFNGTVSNKAAVIIETRFRTNIIPLILHFSSVLGYSWPIIIYTTPEASGQFTTSAALSRYLMSKTIQIRTLPQTVFFDSSDSVSKFMTGRWLWENLAPAEHILVFQSDSMLCANAARSVEDFFEYDFVGPPVASDIGKEYNGGLSIRKRTTVLRILDEWNWEETKTDEDRFEDQWYFNRIKTLQEQEAATDNNPDDLDAVRLPSMEVARTFSVGSIDYPHPLGVHQVHRWQEDKLAKLEEWCPEFRLCSENRLA